MQESSQHKPSRLLDLRFVIGSMFLIFGVLVTGAGLVADDASIEQAGGINISLWTGLAMLLLSGTFFLWFVKAPLEVAHSREEVIAEHLDEEWGEREVPPSA
jgi:hypothetical protein